MRYEPWLAAAGKQVCRVRRPPPACDPSGLGVSNGPIDNDDNGADRKAVAGFQKPHGMVGPLTYDRMLAEYHKTAGARPDQPVPR